jgi:hypothetical protein
MLCVEYRIEAEHKPGKTTMEAELEFLKSLWGLGTEEVEGYRTLSKKWTSIYPVYDVYQRCILE